MTTPIYDILSLILLTVLPVRQIDFRVCLWVTDSADFVFTVPCWQGKCSNCISQPWESPIGAWS